MSWRNEFLLSTIVLCGSPAIAAAPDLFTYQAQRYEIDASLCQSKADLLGQKLHDFFGVQVVDTGCVQTSEESYDLIVDYYANKKLPLVSTAIPAGGGLDHAGRFDQLRDCEIALFREVDLFTVATGLTPDIGYCYRDAISTGHLWMTKIEAFGTSDIVPQLGTAFVFGQVQNYSQSQFRAAVKRGTEALGLVVSDATIRARMVYIQVSIAFYGEGYQRLLNEEVLRVDSAEQCQQQATLGTQALADTSLILSFCTAASIGDYFALNTMVLNQMPADIYIPTSISYADYPECTADRQRLEDWYSERLSRPLLGVLCGLDDAGHYKPHLLLAKILPV